MCDSVKQTPNEMDLFQKLGVTDAGEMMKLMLTAQKSLENQKKKEEKQNKLRQKEEDRLRPIKEVQEQFKELRRIEKAFDMTKKIEKEAIQERINYWITNVIEPYNNFLEGERATQVFKNNAYKFVDLIRELSGRRGLGIVTSSLRRGSERFFVKTEHGILTSKQASEYLKYIIRTKCLRPIKETCGEIFKNTKVRRDKDGSMCGDDVFQQLSFFQLFSEASLSDIVKQLVIISYDDGFAKAWQRASCHPEIKLGNLPEEVKCKIVNDRLGGTNIHFTDSEDDSDDEEEEKNDSESDSDSD